MTAVPQDRGDGAERYARAALSFLAEPGDPVIGALLRRMSPTDLVSLIRSEEPVPFAEPGPVEDDTTSRSLKPGSVLTADGVSGVAGGGLAAGGRGPGGPASARRALARWRSRLGEMPPPGRLAVWEQGGCRLACPGDPEWPSQLDDLGDARPVVLWLRGAADLRFACLRSVAMVGSRAATAYGSHVATELAADLAACGWTIVSGGAYGIDACAHRGALMAGGCTAAVLASGLSFAYPKGHDALFTEICRTGLMVSECPPDKAPNRPGFLVRNRVIAALSRGTIVVEAALRSGAINTARHARELNRPVLAVPGPITSEQSAGCHELIREWDATCVTSAREVFEMVAPLGAAEVEGEREPDAVAGRDPATGAVVSLDPVTGAVLQAVSRRSGRGPATIATLAGVDLDTALRCLGLLAATGHIERCDQGWRIRRAR